MEREQPQTSSHVSATGIGEPEVFHRWFDSAPEMVALVTASGTILECNPQFAAVFGAQPGDSMETCLPAFLGSVREAISQGRYLTRRAETTRLPGSVAIVQPVRESAEGASRRALCRVLQRPLTTAITRSDPDVQNLIKERDAIIDSSDAGLWISDGEGRVLRVNPASTRISGFSPETVVGRHMEDLVSEGYVDKSATLEVIRTKKKVDMLQKTKDGREVMVSGHPVFDEEGELIRVVVTERDVTEINALHHKLAEEESLKTGYRDCWLELQALISDSEEFIAKSPAMVSVLRQVMRMSQVDSTVLMLGESGTGKGRIADLIHKHSSRSSHPLVKLNCGAIPESLIESELFGYDKGAFTGALGTGKAGYLEVADGGTLFLDEIGELPVPSQVKLLRFLEDGRITRLGSTASRDLNVRIIAATHRDLAEMVENGEFRLDLYYRLNVLPLRVPPLRERPECLQAMIERYIHGFAARMNRKVCLTGAALDALLSYSYPGNVRELMNICERLVVFSDREHIVLHDLPREVIRETRSRSSSTDGAAEDETLHEALERVERQILLKAKEKHGSNQTHLAAVLGVNQTTVGRKLKKHGLL